MDQRLPHEASHYESMGSYQRLEDEEDEELLARIQRPPVEPVRGEQRRPRSRQLSDIHVETRDVRNLPAGDEGKTERRYKMGVPALGMLPLPASRRKADTGNGRKERARMQDQLAHDEELYAPDSVRQSLSIAMHEPRLEFSGHVFKPIAASRDVAAVSELRIGKTSSREPSRGRRALVMTAAIDVGTGCSGYAFAFNSNPLEIRMNKNWSEGGFQSYKTPTAVLTEAGARGKFVSFGYEAEETYRESVGEESGQYELYTNFKMLLYNNESLNFQNVMVTSHSGTERKLLDIWVMSLQFLSKHLLDAISHTTKSKTVPENTIGWVLTVPTIWGDKAKDFMRNAAFQAGLIDELYSDRLTITQEATAAARYCRSTANMTPQASHTPSDYEEITLPVRSMFFVADAGAGTLDCTGLEIQSSRVMREIMIASGQDLGGNQVNNNFIDHMKDVLSAEFITRFRDKQPSSWLTFMRSFEQAKTKVVRNGKGLKIDIPYSMFHEMESMKGERTALTSHVNANTESHGVKETNGIFWIKQDRVEDVIFGPVIREITANIKAHLTRPEVQGVKYVYLVGGFGTCKLLQESVTTLLDSLGRGYQIVKPLESQTAVIKGAVLLGHNSTTGATTFIRRSKMTYGVGTDSPFNPAIHDRKRLIKVGRDVMCTGLFLPFVCKNDEVWKDNPDAHCTMFALPTHAKATSIVVDFYGLDRRPGANEVIYVDSPELNKIGSVRVEMPRVVDNPNREVFLKFDFGEEVIVKATDVTSGNKAKFKLSLEFTS